jgi:hypothetical protein
VKAAGSSEALLNARLNGVTSQKAVSIKSITSVAYPFTLNEQESWKEETGMELVKSTLPRTASS